MDIPIVADAKTALLALLEKAQKLDTQEWLEQIRQWKSQYPLSMKTEGLTPEKVIRVAFAGENPCPMPMHIIILHIKF